MGLEEWLYSFRNKGGSMKLHDFQLQTFTKWITFIPTVEVHIDNPMYKEKNIALILNVFIWHFRWLFINKSEE